MTTKAETRGPSSRLSVMRALMRPFTRRMADLYAIGAGLATKLECTRMERHMTTKRRKRWTSHCCRGLVRASKTTRIS
jgi:hypothetical protein